MKKQFDSNIKKGHRIVGITFLLVALMLFQGCSSGKTDSEDGEEEEISDSSDTAEDGGDSESASTDEIEPESDSSKKVENSESSEDMGSASNSDKSGSDDPLADKKSEAASDPLASSEPQPSAEPAMADPLATMGSASDPVLSLDEKPKKKRRSSKKAASSKVATSDSNANSGIAPLQSNSYEQPVAKTPVEQPQFQMPASRAEVPPVEPVAQQQEQPPTTQQLPEGENQQGRSEVRETASEESTPWYKNMKVLGSLLILGGAGGYAALQMKKRREV